MINCLWFLTERISYNKKLIELEKIWYSISLCIISMGAVCLREINDDYLLVGLIIIFFVETILSARLYVDIREVFLFAGFFSFGLIIKNGGALKEALIFLFSYVIIKQFIINGRELYQKRIFQIFISIGLVFSIVAFLDTLSGYYVLLWGVNDLVRQSRVYYMKYIWNNNIYNTNFLLGYMLPIVSLFIYAILGIRKETILSIIIIFLSIVINIYSIINGGRTTILITHITATIAILIHYTKNRKDKKIVDSYKILFMLLLIVLLIGTGCFAIFYNKIKSFINFGYIKEVIYRDGGILGNIRFQWQLEVLSKLPQYPMGGMHISGLDLAHNFWLDIARTTGWIPFLFFISLLAIFIIDTIKLIIICDTRENEYLFLPMIFIAYTLYNAIEPTVFGILKYMIVYFMISAAIRAVNILKIKSLWRYECNE